MALYERSGSPAVDTWNSNPTPQARVEFLHKTYQHLALAILAFMGIEAILLNIPGIDQLVFAMVSSRIGWFMVLGAFILVSTVAERWAIGAIEPAKQYAGLALFVVAEAIVFLPLLYIAANYAGKHVIPSAAGMTLLVFGGLTAMVLISKKDFGFLGGVLRVAGLAALGVIVLSLIFGFSLGNVFSGLMVAFAGGSVVYQTSNLLHRYHPTQHVAAALGLFSSVALMFWYILRIFIGGRD